MNDMTQFNDTAPIYLQIMDTIKRRLISEELKPGQQLPSVRQTAEDMRVNPNTVIRSYAELEREGIAEKRRGMGTFITENKAVIENVRNEVSHNLVSDFVSGMNECGFSAADIIALVQKHIENRTECKQENV
ncbi:GntR family transcriptional regulator [Treponema sp. OMZ 840]|uniref:GntR family transcriptional regulator n=1 Tax=Treponema sp. OMZ 840 TaxID=244313 RepID=UPI003D8E7ED8